MAVLLLLAALRYREKVPADQRPQVPVPVLFTAQGWDPNLAAVDWLAGKLQDAHPTLTTQAGAELLASGRVTVILDGLDEISPELRPAVLEALSRQAIFRLVLLSRTDEIAEAAHKGILRGAAAIELEPVGPDDAASYLERVHRDPPPKGWQELIARIRTKPNSPLSKALGSPLALTLVRDTYQSGDSIVELLDFCDTLDGTPAGQAVEAITDHLLDRVLPAAYTPRPGQPQPPYDLATAQRTLTAIAAQMNREGTRDLEWWDIPRWAPSTPRAKINGLVFGLLFGLGGGLAAGLAAGLSIGLGPRLGPGLAAGLAGALLLGLAGGIVAAIAAALPDRGHSTSGPRLTTSLTPKKFPAGLVAGLGIGFTVWRRMGPAAGLGIGIVAGLTVWLLFELEDVVDPGKLAERLYTVNPATSWHRNRRDALVVGLGVWFVAGLIAWFVVGPWFGLVIGLVYGFGVGAISTSPYPVMLASVQLAIERRTPVRLMKFLEEAHNRNVLRTVGPAYQFRHARLQDQLAAAVSPGDSNAVAPAGQTTGPTTGSPQ
jgi:hypothetical protein